MALIVTLAVLLMVTVIVVTFATIVRTETVTARSRFEAERAAQFSRMAVDEAMVKLRDHIPLNSHWAVGPGRLVAYQSGEWVQTDLFSGHAAGSPTGSVALNAPLAGNGGGYPILSPNTEHPNPDPMKVAWINVLRDGTRSVDPDYATRLTAENPVVGRYAWWMDAETCKVNLNTAGRAQASFSVDQTTGVGDLQNLSGHPSRLDLSKLDEKGGLVTSVISKATYDFTVSSYFSGDQWPAQPALPFRRLAGEGMKRFASIHDWSQIPGVTPAMVEANQFNLTTRARSPEINPWGYNKWWWQNKAPQRLVTENLPGNRLNAPGDPVYTATSNALANFTEADSRYYVYPAFLGRDSSTLANHTLSQNKQWFGSALGNNADRNFQDYMQNMMELLGRRDWPGMPATSFVDKFGSVECESLAVNLMQFHASTAGVNQSKVSKADSYGVYGSLLHRYKRADGSFHLMSGVGPWPYISEVAVKFGATQAGWTPVAPPNMQWEQTNGAKTKSDRNPGFCPPIAGVDQAKYMNVMMTPQLEFSYPASLGNTVLAASTLISVCDIEVIAEGMLDGVTKIYSGPDYIFGRPTNLQFNGALSTPPRNSQQYPQGVALTRSFTPSSSPITQSFTGHVFYIGPFDIGSTPKITLKLRAAFGVQKVVPQPPTDTPDTVNETPDVPADPHKFVFQCNALTLNPAPFTSLPVTPPSYEVSDPRASRYAGDWQQTTHLSGSTIGSANSGYESSFEDPLTGIVGDDSKLAWPDMRGIASNTNRRFHMANHLAVLPGLGWISILPVNSESSKTSSNGKPVPWRTLNFGPAIRSNQLPDWLLLDAFAMAYDSSYLGQTEGKINLNTEVYPFGFHRTAPLKALLIPSAANSTTSAAAIVAELVAYTGINAGPCHDLPDDFYVYPGQICQLPSLQGSGTNQFQREALIRDVAGLLTAQSSDFTVHVVAQSLNPQGKPIAEQRVRALISRTVDVGPDGVPGTSDDMAGPDRMAGTADDLTFQSDILPGSDRFRGTGDDIPAVTISKLKYDGTDLPLEGGSGRPPFQFRISNLEIVNR